MSCVLSVTQVSRGHLSEKLRTNDMRHTLPNFYEPKYMERMPIIHRVAELVIKSLLHQSIFIMPIRSWA